jgi:natural product precursor
MRRLKKLALKKETIAKLDNELMSNLKGGTDSTDMPPWTGTYGFTAGECDLHTFGHDDGPNCLSKTDWGWCWCYGIG